MKLLSTLILSAAFSASALGQTTITNGGFENWGNTVPASDIYTEPTNWYSDQSGGGFASFGPQTCFQSTTAHSGTYSVKVVTENSIIAGAVNGVVTTGVVNAPSTTKTDGYIGTINASTPSDIRRMSFTGRPDSLVGWYQYTPGATTERAKIRAILHIGNYFDPETPTTYHPNPIDSQVASALFLTDTPGTTIAVWTRFSVPFVYTTGLYASGMAPAYILINVTPSNDQGTTVTGSTFLLDDLQAVYNPPATCDTVTSLAASAITATTATISWAAVTGAAGYMYAVDINAAPPASGTFTTATSVPVTGLTAATLYYAHVLDTCTSGTNSAWVTVPFATTGFTGVKSITGNNFAISAFPNPVNDELTINISGVAQVAGQVCLMDISGRIISSTVADAGTVSINMSGLSAGIYFVRYIDAAHTQTIKISKQ